MLRKFKVSNFKCFENDFELDFTQTRGYEFNTECVKDSTVNNAIIYGHNGVGKSNLTLAIFDIIEHLTDKEKNPKLYVNYLNANSTSKYALFRYEFLIDSKEVVYEYKKSNYTTILCEQLYVDGNLVIEFDRENCSQAIISLPGTENLNKEIKNTELSVIKYVKNNSELIDDEVNTIFKSFYEFADKMLFFRSLEFNAYLGLQAGQNDCLIEIIENDNIKEFEEFLNDCEIECKLKVLEDASNNKSIYFDFENKPLHFSTVASTGTKSLALFFYWYQKIKENNKVSFLMIDEFDAFYHNEVAIAIVEKLKSTGIQFILTSHNLSIMTNDLLRPDCYFSMNKSDIKSFANLTTKELRVVHNLEKMYKAGKFNV